MHPPHHSCLLLLFFLATASTDAGDITLLLHKIKPALQGASPNAQLATWNATTPLCLWRGLRWTTLRCDTAKVRADLTLANDTTLLLSSIRLPAAGLAGRLPPELGAFSALDSLYLAANSLSGPIPLDLGNAPALSVLDLAGNALSGALPPSIWNLCDRLVELRLHGNRLAGSIPTPAGPNTTCDRLRVLDLGVNRFSSDFPSFLTTFPALQRLDLGANSLSGPIPDSLAAMTTIKMLNLSYNNFSGQMPPGLLAGGFTAESFVGNSPALCGPPLREQCVSTSGLSSGGVAGMVIGLMAGAVVVASVSIGWAQGRWRRNRVRRAAEEGIITETEEGGDGKLVVFQGGEHLTLEEVLNATGQVVEKASYCTVYKAKLSDGGGNIELRLLREGSCKDAGSCGPVVRRIGRARHENLVPLRAFYQGRRGEKLLVYDYFPHRTLHDLLHGAGAGEGGRPPALTWPRRHKIALGAARALAYLHAGDAAAAVVHGNMRSSNVLVDEFFVARVTEYAVGPLLVPSAADAVVAAAKADGYRAPELQTMRRCSPRTDVYAFGILLLELLMGRKPSSDLPSLVKVAVLEETTMEVVFDAEVAKGVRSPTEEGLVQALKLAMGCCAPVAAARPSMAEVVRQLEENRPKSSRSALYSPAETRSEAGTPTIAA